MCAELSSAVGEPRQLEQCVVRQHGRAAQQQQREQRVSGGPGLLLTILYKAFTQ